MTILLFVLMMAEGMPQVIERALDVARRQSLSLAATVEPLQGRLPKTWERGELQTSEYHTWITGFFPGTLWLLWQDRPDPQLRRYAELYTDRVEPAKHLTDTHDLGFMLGCSFGNGWRLTGNEHYRDVMAVGAASLATRYVPQCGVIRSWEPNDRWQCPVIIDNMMNLEFLCDAAAITGDTAYAHIAVSHASTTLAHHFRPDASSYHVVSYDTLSGLPHAKNTHQGYKDRSAWARGQGWALYGYTMMYRQTGRPEYLAQARRVADFLCSHPRMPDDKVPYWDFDAPNIPETLRDASAAAVMASAFAELSWLDRSADNQRWLSMAEAQVRSLASPDYLAEAGSNGGFILMHSVGNLNKASEVDVPLTYADYYFVEAMLRLKHIYKKRARVREYWVDALDRLARPVLSALAQGRLAATMPYQSLSPDPVRRDVSRLEAVGRTLCGIAPWLELGPDSTAEGQLRAQYIDMALAGLANAVDPASPDYLVFDDRHTQPLVDAAWLAQALLRAPTQLWGRLPQLTRQRIVTELERTRAITPHESNWVLFASMVEAALLQFTGQADTARLNHGVRRFVDEGWYKGDGWYGDGPEFRLDYYNSLVIHPMLTDVLRVMATHRLRTPDDVARHLARQQRLSQQLERLIMPDGTYPVVGRSIVYRGGSFHALAQTALMGDLPPSLPPGQVREALGAVLHRQTDNAANWGEDGWLRVGVSGDQLGISEPYINTGSLYMASTVLLPLGLPADDAFWAAPPVDVTNARAWRGDEVEPDHALKGL